MLHILENSQIYIPLRSCLSMCFGREKLSLKYPCTADWNISYRSSGFKSLWDVRGHLLSTNDKHHTEDLVLEQTAVVQGCFGGAGWSLIWFQIYRKFCQCCLHVILGMAENFGRFIQVWNSRFGWVNPETEALNKVGQFHLTLNSNSQDGEAVSFAVLIQ